MPKRRKTAPADAAPTVFARGFIATALLTAVQDRSGDSGRRVLCRALQGGAALAAGSAAADALARRRYGIALAAATIGTAAVLAAEQLLPHTQRPHTQRPHTHRTDDKEIDLGEEIAQEG